MHPSSRFAEVGGLRHRHVVALLRSPLPPRLAEDVKSPRRAPSSATHSGASSPSLVAPSRSGFYFSILRVAHAFVAVKGPCRHCRAVSKSIFSPSTLWFDRACPEPVEGLTTNVKSYIRSSRACRRTLDTHFEKALLGPRSDVVFVPPSSSASDTILTWVWPWCLSRRIRKPSWTSAIFSPSWSQRTSCLCGLLTLSAPNP